MVLGTHRGFAGRRVDGPGHQLERTARQASGLVQDVAVIACGVLVDPVDSRSRDDVVELMEQQGLPINTINDLMRICMSSSGAANLYRLRRGALWVNRVIRGLILRGWGHGATELFLLCKNFRPSLPRSVTKLAKCGMNGAD